ncbi:uncharacterized protein JCM15063_001985 [Sporobolomyces koalae]|uniref:uncharacterized protein n=1 Tax=Sporobolomyces koalae TaxID=500713 RepID=UPI00317F8853
MQNLASYGSDDSDDDRQSAAPVPAPAPAPVQPTRTLNPAPSALKRLKTSHSSHPNSPLSGVVSTLSRSSTPKPSTPSASSSRKPNERSASPPPFTRQETRSPRSPSRTRESAGVDLTSLSQFGIPPVPTGDCNPAVQAKLSNFEQLRRSRGLHFNDSLSSSKAFRNPRIYTKLVEFMDVDETGTGFDRAVWDRHAIGRDGTALRLAELQKLKADSKQASHLSTTASKHSISFTSAANDGRGSSNNKSYHDVSSRYHERDKKRSRWDNKN